MDLSHPAFDLFGENEGRILHRLSVLPGGASGRHIHKLAGVKTLRTTQQILDRYVRMGLVDVVELGPSNQYTLNREHILWRPIETILATPAELEQKIADVIARTLGSSATVAAVYGSFARGEAGPASDLDILVVWADDASNEDQNDLLYEASERVRRLIGNEVHLLAVSGVELDRLRQIGDPLVDSLREDARNLTEGIQIKSLLGKN